MSGDYGRQAAKNAGDDPTLISAYSPHSIYDYVDAEPDYKVSAEVIDLTPLKTHMFNHGVLITVYLPGVKTTASAKVAWCYNPLVHAIDNITLRSSSVRGKYVITGRDIEDIIQWWRNSTISNERWNRMLGNTPELQTFTNELKPYHETFMIPLFFHEQFPLHLKNLSEQGVTINIKLKNPDDLLRVSYAKDRNRMYLDHNHVPSRTKIYKNHIEIGGPITCRTSYRITNCAPIVEFAERMYSNRFLPTFKEFKSSPDVINMSHKAELVLDCNVTAIMWKLEAVYSSSYASEADLHTMGAYNLDPMEGSDKDPVSNTVIEIITDNNETKKWEFTDTESRQNHIDSMTNPFQTGYHCVIFGANSLSCLKTNGIAVKNITITCRSSDNSEVDSGMDGDIDEEDTIIDEEDEYKEESLSDKAKKLPDRRPRPVMSQVVTITNNAIRYRLVARAVIVSQMEIGEKMTTFK